MRKVKHPPLIKYAGYDPYEDEFPPESEEAVDTSKHYNCSVKRKTVQLSPAVRRWLSRQRESVK